MCQLPIGFDFSQGYDQRIIAAASRGDFIGDVSKFEEAGRPVNLLNECADARDAADVSVAGQFSQSPVGGHARYAESRGKFVFGGYASAGRPAARTDIGQDMVLNLPVARLAAVLCQDALHGESSRPALKVR